MFGGTGLSITGEMLELCAGEQGMERMSKLVEKCFRLSRTQEHRAAVKGQGHHRQLQASITQLPLTPQCEMRTAGKFSWPAATERRFVMPTASSQPEEASQITVLFDNLRKRSR